MTSEEMRLFLVQVEEQAWADDAALQRREQDQETAALLTSSAGVVLLISVVLDVLAAATMSAGVPFAWILLVWGTVGLCGAAWLRYRADAIRCRVLLEESDDER